MEAGTMGTQGCGNYKYTMAGGFGQEARASGMSRTHHRLYKL